MFEAKEKTLMNFANALEALGIQGLLWQATVLQPQERDRDACVDACISKESLGVAEYNIYGPLRLRWVFEGFYSGKCLPDVRSCEKESSSRLRVDIIRTLWPAYLTIDEWRKQLRVDED